MVTEQLAELVGVALRSAVADGVISEAPEPVFERPKRREHGDWATNVALVAGKGHGTPREIAQEIVSRLPGSKLVAATEIAGPGFINFRLSPQWLFDVIRRAADPDGGFGRSDIGRGRKINVEYVSANPTGPINVVSGRHAAVGDALSNLFETTGHEVTREFYINDAGRQIQLFASSVAARYLQHFEVAAEVPEDGYQGDYVMDLAREIAGEVGDRYVAADAEERDEAMQRMGLERMRARIQATLARFGTVHDVWFSETQLHASGEVKAAIERLDASGWTVERDGATWFRSSELGDDKDRVLIRANGEPTYFASDVAYLLDKLERGFDKAVYLWGADHHGTLPRMKALVRALELPEEALEIRLLQIVRLSSEGQTLKGSKRKGVFIELDDLLDEVDPDVARYTFLTRSIDAPLDFDIALAKEQAPENPVYYVQYAHARIHSILRRAASEGLSVDVAGAPLDRLGGHPSEDELMRKLAAYEEVVIEAAEMRAPQKITRYVEELASTFSSFYRDCRVVSDDRELSTARLALAEATGSVIALGLGLLGVRAPERM